jgi:O-antigen/teichoic acid export membrane protein
MLSFENKIKLVNIISSFSVIMLNILIQIFLTPIFIETLGVEIIAIKSISTGIISFTNIFAVSIASMSARFVSINYYSKKINDSNQYFSSIVLGTFLFSLLFLIIFLFLLFIVWDLYESISILLMFIFTLGSFLFVFISNPFTLYIFVTEKLYIKSLIQLIFSLSNMFITILLFSFFRAEIFLSLSALVLRFGSEDSRG